ncbi:MAG: adenosylmethionine--8-amino-7-oxononanoate transaminase [Candidatus Omnitrophica bacterium]|nr:adenosylmethionine--8-amino-7-oxononanoate transaminase [Candidatus Omnitrophota bacterium]
MNKWIEKDLEYVWHPYTQMKDNRKSPPILIKKAAGAKLYDEAGKFYYDSISSWWCNVHGHNHPKIKQAINRQLESLEHVLFAGFTHEPAIALAERLIKLTKNKFAKVFYSDDGSTAVEVALKISFQYWRNLGITSKRKFVCLDYGYHGDTIGTMSVSGIDMFNDAFKPLFFPSFRVPSPYCYRCPMGKVRLECGLECVKPLEKILKEHSREISGLILEPMVLCAGGMIVYPKEYLEKAAALAKKYKVHLILDEVATGFGRTGKMFAYEHASNINPDFLCLSKGISAGYLPLAATLTTGKIYRAFYADYSKRKTFFHGHTYTANPLACAAGVASLEVFDRENTLANVKKISLLLKNGLARFKDLDIVGDVRLIGAIGALELVKNKQTKERFSSKKRLGFEIYKKGLKEGLVLRPLGDIIYLFLPLAVKENELKDILSRFYRTLKSFS